jgi:hypothetical protein
MKKIIFLLIFLPVITQSQNWYPIGATWYYNYQDLLPFPAHGYTKYTVVKDTVVDSKQSKLVTMETVRYNGNTTLIDSIIVREDSSKVYYYNNNSFQLMYDFTLNIGDTLGIDITSPSCDSVSPLIVDSIKILNIDGIDLKVQFIKGIYFYDPTWGGQSDTLTYKIVERVGYARVFFFNPVCQIGDEFGWNGLRCYNDSNISYQGNQWDYFYPYPCDTLINGATGIMKIPENENKVVCFPNPATDFVSVKFNDNTALTYSLNLYNAIGKLIKSMVLDKNEKTIKFDIRNLSEGLYFINAINTSGNQYSGKFIKN